MSRRLAVSALLLLAVLLTGCGGRVVTEFYVRDIFDVVEGVEESLFTPSTVVVESPGDEYNEQLIELLEQSFRDPSNARTVTEDYTTYVAVDVKVPILLLDDYYDLWENEDPIGLIVFEMDEGGIGFGLGLNSDKLDVMFAAFQEELWETASIEDFTFTILLNNDTRDQVLASFQGVYVNGLPIAYEESFEMARRDTLEIRLGDVARDAAYLDGLVVLGFVE
ncbi:MAG: DUF7424 family protein [Limnochordia bacterium]|jgi:hypothetical protein|nr:hypothetical protein [Bacillota bacterium]